MFPYLQEVELQAPQPPRVVELFSPREKRAQVGAASECELAVALAAVTGVAHEVGMSAVRRELVACQTRRTSGTAGGWLLQMGLGRARSCGDLRLEIGTAEW